MDECEKRNLTEQDVQAIVDELESRLEKRFFLNLGRGVWSIAWKVAITGVIILSAIGSLKGDRLF